MQKASSVRTKLFLAIFGPSFLVLAILGSVWMLVDAQRLRLGIVRETEMQASVLARAAQNVIPLDDDITLRHLLATLEADKDVILAAIYLPDGEIVAEYPQGAPVPATPEPGIKGNTLSIVQEVTSGNELLGRLLVQASLAPYHQRLRFILLEALAVLVLMTFVAALVANTLRKRMLKPLENLAATARTISEKKDYSVRATGFEDQEFEAVTGAFNHMLQEIEKQNDTLSTTNTELREANRELEAFTYSVSHDLRTPLRAISSYAQILARLDEPLPKRAHEYLDRIYKNATKMAQLIDDLLAFSRIDAHPLDRQEVNLTEIAGKAWDELSSQSNGRAIEFKLEELGKAKGDPALIYQVFTNLFGNSVKYSRGREPAKISAGCLPSKDESIYYVRDNGVGFDMKYSSKLFGVFQRLHSEKEFEGTGVGLALVQRIISRHEGRVWAESEPDKGATFYFTLNK